MKLSKCRLKKMNFWYRSDDRVIGQRIALDKFEKYETALMESQINIDGVFVDVGANIGYYSLLMAKICKKVYAIEPDAECFEILKKNVEENNLKNVVLLKMAASNKKEKKYLIKDKENQGNGRIQSTPIPSFDKEGRRTFYDEVITDTLDNILKIEQKISCIKIDTQGWEAQVIEGAKKMLKRDEPTLFLEYTPSEYMNNKMINFLKKNYKNIWSINDFAEVPWPIFKGVKIKGKNGYADLFLKKKMEIKDYLVMIKNVHYKKFLKGIMNLICQK